MYVDFYCKDDEYIIFEDDFDHVNNTYDIEGYKELWGNIDESKDTIFYLEKCNKQQINNAIKGTRELAKEHCRDIVNKYLKLMS